MINKLRKNINLADVVVRVLLALSCAFASWRTAYQTLLYSQFSDFAVIQGSSAVYVACLTALVSGVLAQFIAAWLSNLFVTANGFTVSRSEFGFWVKLFVTAYYFTLGALDLINLFTPLAVVWLATAVPFVVLTACFVGFYVVTKRLYFSDDDAPRYFYRLSLIYVIFAILQLVSGISRIVTLVSGGAL